MPRETILVWSIQHAGCWREFQRRGVLAGDGRRVDREWRPAYQWLMGQMQGRVPGYGGGFPVWFWHSPKPDLRHTAHLPRGQQGVRIEVEVPRDRVLLLDFETWHCVLNGWHLSRSWRESRAWERRASKPAAELQSTWERVFDFDFLRRSKLWGKVERIQGVTEYVRMDEVRRVDEFMAR